MAALATAYHGPPQLTLPRAFTEWTADPAMITLAVILFVGYLAGVYAIRRRGGEWKTGRIVAFCLLGVGFLVYGTMSWVGVYQNTLFYARASQTVLLVLLAPLFLAMGKPMTLFIENFPGPGEALVKVVRSRVSKIVTFPAITALLLVGLPMVMYFTNWYTATFTSGTARELTFLALMASGYLFFWTLLRVDPVPKEYPYGVAMWITAAEIVGDMFFGIAIIADTSILASAHYHAVAWPYGPSLATGQVLGGGIIWILGDAVGLPFLAVQLIQMMRADKVEAAQIDAELDAREAAREARKAARAAQRAARAAWRDGEEYPAADAAAPGTQPAVATADPDADDEDDADDVERPWWENDSRITERFGRG
jgi:cytochrome c oxidase assembly factor CtaG